jgi:imidazolonepropionase-like amidohydrolase
MNVFFAAIRLPRRPAPTGPAGNPKRAYNAGLRVPQMRPSKSLAVAVVAGCLGSAGAFSQPRAGSAVVFEGARLIAGDGRPTLERAAFVVQGGRITAVGAMETITAPPGASRVDLDGRTVIPALVNVHVHIGYEGYTSWGAANYTPQNVLDHLQREAFYGVGATQSVGSSPTAASLKFERDQAAGVFPPASRFFFMPGLAPPNGGPDAILMKGTTALHAVHEVTTPAAARAVVQGIAARRIRNVKIWVDDRRGTYPKMPPEVYTAVIDEAHKHRMLVHAHAIALADQKAVVRAGADVLVHTAASEKVDDEFLALLTAKRPYWTTVIGLGDRSEVCDRHPFVDQTYPAKTLESIRGESCGPRPAAAAREETLAYNVPRMIAAGARLVLGTDAGIDARHAFGWADHHEIARWVQLGVSPAAALVAATARPAELLGAADIGTLVAGKSADFVVLTANPLDDIRNTRAIDSVYLRGIRLDREAWLAKWQRVVP